ncbi:MAG: phage terminase large subunit family protein, partial [Proteobacteria bacterium]|nr:phage terminase large subunit family protein [Pseudomonadota bacterium]
PTQQDVTYKGAKIKNGIQLWPVGTDTAKSTIYSRLRIPDPGPGYCHFPVGLSDDFFVQLTAEKQVTRYVKGFPRLEWIKIRKRNEALDCCVYAYAAALRAGLARTDWDSLEMNISTKSEEPETEKPRIVRSNWMRR